MFLRSLTLLIALGCTAAVAGDGEPVPDERVAAYREFRTAFDAANYAAAVEPAQRVVQLTREQFGAQAPELVNPLTNLGATHYRLQQYEQAMDAFRAALTVLDQDADSADERLARPLLGLGVSLRALGRDQEAIVPLKRAVDITRNREGLFAQSQLPLLRPLIAAYMNDLRREDAGREQQYAFTIAETAFGRNDVRLLEPLDELARWNEAVGRYSMARLLHARAVQVADSAPNSKPVLAVPGLRGIARTYRLAYLYGETEESAAAANSASMSDSMLQRVMTGPPSDGERALRVAVERIRAATPLDSRLLGEVLTDLGDWFLTASNEQRAWPAYREAWNALSAVGAAEPLATPAPLTYKPPSVAVSRSVEDPELFRQQDVQLRLSVNAMGDVRDAVVTNPAPDAESAERAVISALKRSVFRPAIVGGEPVASGEAPFHERVWVKLPDPDKPAKAPANTD